MERDEESGPVHHGARYYAPWLGTWVSCDPAGPGGADSLYVYCATAPTNLSDPDGAWPEVPAAMKGFIQGGLILASDRVVSLPPVKDGLDLVDIATADAPGAKALEIAERRRGEIDALTDQLTVTMPSPIAVSVPIRNIATKGARNGGHP